MQGFLNVYPSGARQGKEAGEWNRSRTYSCLCCMTVAPHTALTWGKKGLNSLPKWPQIHMRSCSCKFATSCCIDWVSEMCRGPGVVSEKLCPGLNAPGSAPVKRVFPSAPSGSPCGPAALAGGWGRPSPASRFREGGAPPPCGPFRGEVPPGR